MGQKTTLVGESFAPWVKDQVEARQNLLGRTTAQKYTNEELKYINGKTAFLRLVSGVNINDNKGPNNTTRLQDLGLSDTLLGNELAKFFVLEGGTSFFPSGASNGTTEFRSGIVDKLNETEVILNNNCSTCSTVFNFSRFMIYFFCNIMLSGVGELNSLFIENGFIVVIW